MRLEGTNLSFSYNTERPVLRNVNISIKAGERVALVGPSGCGKSTLAKILAGYLVPDEGEVLCDGHALPKNAYCPVQLIYQHPELAVNPRWKMNDILTEAWTPDEALLKDMGIEAAWLSRYPAELSGGELQRFCIARALGPGTKYLIADEMTTMLDAITQAQIWEIVLAAAEKRNLGLLVVTHSEALAARTCTRTVTCDEKITVL